MVVTLAHLHVALTAASVVYIVVRGTVALVRLIREVRA